jgi:hypothetical protein
MSSTFSLSLADFLLLVVNGILIIVTIFLVRASDKLGNATDNLVKATKEMGSIQILPSLHIQEGVHLNFTEPNGKHIVGIENLGNGNAINVKLLIKGEDGKPKNFVTARI